MGNIFDRPLIGVVMCRNRIKGHLSQTLQEKYLNAVLHAGGLPIPLPHARSNRRNDSGDVEFVCYDTRRKLKTHSILLVIMIFENRYSYLENKRLSPIRIEIKF